VCITSKISQQEGFEAGLAPRGAEEAIPLDSEP
jgi:hypothetical protein